MERTRIRHCSIAVRNPEKVATALAELTQGEAQPFSPVAGGFVCLWGGWEGDFIEFYPRGVHLVSGPEGAHFESGGQTGDNSTHLNLEINKPLLEVKQIADRYGLTHCFRAGGGGPLYEVWLEDDFLVELVSKEIAR